MCWKIIGDASWFATVVVGEVALRGNRQLCCLRGCTE